MFLNFNDDFNALGEKEILHCKHFSNPNQIQQLQQLFPLKIQSETLLHGIVGTPNSFPFLSLKGHDCTKLSFLSFTFRVP